MYDEETRLYYLRARYYDPALGWFINEDSFEGQVNNPLSMNVYTYCYNNPLIYTDPSGNFPVVIPVPETETDTYLFQFPAMPRGNDNWRTFPGMRNSSDKGLGDIFTDGLNKWANSIDNGIKKNKKDILIITFPITIKTMEIIQSNIRTTDNTPKNVYNSIKDAPKYPEGFSPLQNGTEKITVKNKELLSNLRKIESGEWKKIYKDGYDANGNKVSTHYFQSKSGKVYDVDVKSGWSNQ